MSDKNNKNNKNNNDQDPFDFFKLVPEDNGDKKDDDDNKQKKSRILWIGLLIAAILIIFLNLSGSFSQTDTIPLSKFTENIKEGRYVRVDLSESYFVGYPAGYNFDESAIEGLSPFKVFKEKTIQAKKADRTYGLLSQNFLNVLDEQTEKQTGFEYKMVPKQRNYILDFIFSWIIPFGFIFIMWRLMFKRIGSGMGGMGSIFGAGASRHKAVDEGKVQARFSDVAGVDEAKEELVEVVDFLKEPKKYTDIGGKIPKGVLLVGPPGTGKTLLARAVAGEAGVPFFRISGSDFVEMFVGVGASRVRDLFRQAREKAPCIIFIDELDAIGKSRANNLGGNDEREQTLNQLLVEMDGFDNENGLIILAATNRADILDPALLRPGRFDRQVPVEKPDLKGREEILKIHAKKVKLDNDVSFESVAHGTIGFAGADLANVVNEAALLAVRKGRKLVSMEDFNDAIDKVSIGLKKKSRKENKKQMRLTSVHETGHALVAAFTPGHEPVNKITVVPRSHGVGGFTQFRENEEEKFALTKTDMLNEVDSMLGGRAAEQVILNDISTGASNDIARATEIIKSMIVDYGMSDRFKNMTLGKGVLGNRGGEPVLVREFSEDTQKYIDEEIERIMAERYNHVVSLLSQKKDLLEYIANRLVEVETMESKEFYDIINAHEHCVELGANTASKDTAEEQ
jgi:cell division protease FtsH